MNGKQVSILSLDCMNDLLCVRLTDAPSTPMRLIYNVLRKYLRKHVVYIDDIIIYLKILLEHVEHVKLVLITHR